jgi:hypothetical protein
MRRPPQKSLENGPEIEAQKHKHHGDDSKAQHSMISN